MFCIFSGINRDKKFHKKETFYKGLDFYINSNLVVYVLT